jgi:membrane protease YdiL (CAAX protease family)
MLVLFYALAFGWSWGFLLVEYLSTGGARTGTLWRFVASLGPLLAALVVTARYGGRAGLKDLVGRAFRGPTEPYWYAIALLGYGLVPLGALELHVFLGDPRPKVTADALEFLPLMIPFILLDGPLNEELGWRGVALSHLQLHHSALAASVFVGILWALWHWPLALLPGTLLYQVPFVLYLVHVCALSILFAWLYNASGGSLLLTILFHGSVNTWSTVIPTGLPAVAGEHLYLLNVALVCLVAVVVILLADVRTLARPHWASG